MTMTGQVAQLQVASSSARAPRSRPSPAFPCRAARGRSRSRRSISSATRPFSADGNAVALQLEAARQEQAVDLVVVDHEQPRAAVSGRHARRKLRQRRGDARVFRARAHRAAASSTCRDAVGCRRAPDRAPSRPAPSAPNVLLLDLSECAARRKLIGVASGERAAAVLASISGASARNVSTSSRHELARRRSAASSSNVALIDRRVRVMSSVLACCAPGSAPRPGARRGSAW